MRSLSLIIYTFIFYLLLPVFLLRLLWRSFKSPQYRCRLSERFGFFPSGTKIVSPVVWIHTVSVGETIAAKPLICALLEKYPDHQLLITTTTPTGSSQVNSLFKEDILQERVLHSYIPYDVPGCISRFVSKVNPVAAIFMETEVWPNILAHCDKKNIPAALINARLSEKSLRGYQRFESLSKSAFSRFKKIAAQSQSDADRIALLSGKNISVTGSVKMEVTVDDELLVKAENLKSQWSDNGKRKIIIAASTHKGEDEIILSVYHKILQSYSNALLVVVPRHPERFASVKQLCEKENFCVVCRSEQPVVSQDAQVVLGDTMGELMLLCGVSDIVVMGGSFVNHGGHNMLEPAAWGLPIISGASVFNFSKITEDLVGQSAMVLVNNKQELEENLLRLLEYPEKAKALGENAKNYVDQNRGVLQKLLQVIDGIIS